MEPMRGRLQDNTAYVEKEGDLTTWGQKPDQGRRTGIVGLKRKIVEGAHPIAMRGGGLGSRPIFKKFNEPYAPS